MPDFPIQPGDTVTVRGTVVQYIAGVGVLVELFSKTDQYEAWVREDLIAEHVPQPDLPDEPEAGFYVGLDREGIQVGLEHEDRYGWYVTGVEGGLTWPEVSAQYKQLIRLVPESVPR